MTQIVSAASAQVLPTILWLAFVVVAFVAAIFVPRVTTRALCVVALVLFSVVLGTKVEKLLWLNRHIDVCVDDTSGSYRRDLAEGDFCGEALHVFQ
jgi:hypothetical protein